MSAPAGRGHVIGVNSATIGLFCSSCGAEKNAATDAALWAADCPHAAAAVKSPETRKESAAAVRLSGPGGTSASRCGVLVHRPGGVADGSGQYFVLTAGHVVHALLAEVEEDASQLQVVMPAIAGVPGREAAIRLPCREIRSAYPICQQVEAIDHHNRDVQEAAASYDIAVLVLGPLPKVLEAAALEVPLGDDFLQRPCYAGMTLNGVYWERKAIDRWREHPLQRLFVQSLATTFVQLDADLPTGASGAGLLRSKWDRELVAIITTRSRAPSYESKMCTGATLVTFFRPLLQAQAGERPRLMPPLEVDVRSSFKVAVNKVDWRIQTIDLVAQPGAAAAAAATAAATASRAQARHKHSESVADLDHSKAKNANGPKKNGKKK